MSDSASDTLIITGGAGFIGSNLVRLVLNETPSRVVVLDKLTYAGNRVTLADVASNPRFELVEGDIADRSLVDDLLLRVRPRAVLNLAAETHVDRSIDGPRAFVQTNLVGTFELLEASRAYLARSDAADRARFRFLHVSTDEVFGSLGPEGKFSETTPYAPRSPYAASKAGADHLVRAYHETFDVPVLVTNCSNNYGPYQHPEKLIPLMTLNALEGRPLPIYGDGGNVRDWLYVEDHCRGLLRVLDAGRLGGSYNLGGDSEKTNLEVVDTLCRILDELHPPHDNPQLRGRRSYSELKSYVADRPGHDRRYAIDATKVRTELGWKPRHSFETGLRATARWYLENRSWCDSVQSRGYRRERLGLPSTQPERGK